MSRARDLADSADKDIVGTITVDGLTVAGNVSADGGTIKLDGNYPVGSNNVALGNNALSSGSLSGANNTAIGREAMVSNTSGSLNVALGSTALDANTTGSSNTAVGQAALGANNTASENTAVGYRALLLNTTGAYNVALGAYALDANTTAGSNTAIGRSSLGSNTTGGNNAALGYQSLFANTTASNNTALGYRAGYALTNAGGQTGRNTFIGMEAGYNCNGDINTFVGQGSGSLITSGRSNTIIGRFTGNQNSLDIRTSNNQIVLSDGDGNPRVRVDSVGNFKTGSAVTNTPWSRSGTVDSGYYFGTGTTGNNFFAVNATSLVAVFNRSLGDGTIVEFKREGTVKGTVSISSSGTTYNTTSDRRLKNNIEPIVDATDKLMDMKPVTHTWIANPEAPSVHGFIAQEMQEIVPEAVSGKDGGEEMMSMDYGRITPVLVAALQEATNEIKALKQRVLELEEK